MEPEPPNKSATMSPALLLFTSARWEQSRNLGDIFPWWDHLFRTYLATPARGNRDGNTPAGESFEGVPKACSAIKSEESVRSGGQPWTGWYFSWVTGPQVSQ